MGPRLEHLSVLFLGVAGQAAGQIVVHFVGPLLFDWFRNGLPAALVGIVVGVGLTYLGLFAFVAVILLLGKLGVIDVKTSNASHPGFH